MRRRGLDSAAARRHTTPAGNSFNARRRSRRQCTVPPAIASRHVVSRGATAIVRQATHRAAAAAGQEPSMRSLQNPWMTRLLQDSAIWLRKNLFVFNDRTLGFANFRKFFFGRNEGNQRVVGEKVWNHRFLNFAASPEADLCIEVIQKSP
jgi:hypothetical protein